MKKIAILILSLPAIIVFGQTDTKYLIQNSLKNTAVQSPNIASLFKFNEIPVSLYTGVPNIEIPIYDIKVGDIKVPISIKYHGGIKVNEEASPVGLGWALNAGGSISQIMSGGNDFGAKGYYNKKFSNALGESIDGLPMLAPVTAGCYPTSWNSSTQPNSYYSDNFKTEGYMENVIDADMDFQPDLFQINLPSESYKAYLDMGNTTQNDFPKFHTLGQQNIKIKLIPNDGSFKPDTYGNYNFSVVNDQGTTFLFEGEKEITEPIIGYNTIIGLTKYLTKIKSNTDEVTFSYSQGIFVDRLSGCKNTFIKGIFSTNQKGDFICNKQKINERNLEKINFPNGRIEFIWSDREDMINAKKLSSIKVYNNSMLIKSINFNYDYFSANESLNLSSNFLTFIGAANTKFLTHRLKLSNINNSLTNENYSFEYNAEYNLPHKLSFATDYWGYYNGQSNGYTFIPNPEKYLRGEHNIELTDFSKDNAGYFYNAAAMGFTNGNSVKTYLSDRRPSLKSLAGVLKSIKYPTGSKTIFEFEPNTFSNYPLQSLINDNSQANLDSFQTFYLPGGGQNYISDATREFVVSGNNVKVNLNIFFDFYYKQDLNGGAAQSFWIYIKNKNNGQIIKKIYNPNITSYTISSIQEFLTLASGTYEIGTDSNSYFTQNLYNIFQKNNVGSTNLNQQIINNLYQVSYSNDKSIINGVIHNYTSGGGLRIKSISTYESSGSVPVIRNYIYDEIINNGSEIKSFGKLAELPKYYEIKNRCFYFDIVDGGHFYKSRPDCTDDPYYSLDRISIYEGTPSQGISVIPQGGEVAYSKVIERVDNKGYTENYFFNNFDFSCLNLISRGQQQYLENGNLLKQIIYTPNGNKIKELENNYINNFTDNLHKYFLTGAILESAKIFIDNMPYSGTDADTYLAPEAGVIHLYPINLYKSLLKSTTIKEYFPEGSSNYVETKTLTTYNNKYLPSIQKTTYPDTSFTETNYNYALEKGNQLLISKNMIGIPLEITTSQTVANSTKTLSKTEIIYPTALPTTQTANFVLPTSILSYDLQTLTSSTPETTYDKYDSKGKLQQYTSKDGLSTTIIWGYSNTQPIAKIEGAKLSDISQTLIDSIVNASANDAQVGTDASEQSMISALDLFRTHSALSGYQITTYSYDPLIGVKSITPPSGIREVYMYDTANRLMEIRENSATGKILKEFKYNYKQ